MHRWTLIPVLLGLAACQSTASGRAISSRFAASMRGLLGSTQRVLGSELDRGTRFPRRVYDFLPDPTDRLSRVTRSTENAVRGEVDRLGAVPREAVGFVDQVGETALGDLASLTDTDSRIIQQNRPAVMLARFRDEVRRIPSWIDLGAPVLKGPGDPDRSTDPDHRKRRETFVERLLRRF